MLRGRFGRSLRAVRDSELAAASSGVNLARYKTLAFGISAFYAGMAGSLLAIATTFVNPDTFPIALSIFLLVGVVVGGLGSLWPLVFGAIFIHFMQIEWAQRVESVIPNWLPLLGDIDTDAPGAPAVAFGVILILIMLRRTRWRGGRPRHPQGACDPRLPSRSLSLDQGAALPMRRPRLLIPMLVLAGAIATGARAASSADPGITDEDDPARRRPRRSPARRRPTRRWPAERRLLQVREHSRRRQRPHDRLQGTSTTPTTPRRRAGDAPARRAGQGLRDLQLARDRAERGGARRT